MSFLNYWKLNELFRGLCVGGFTSSSSFFFNKGWVYFISRIFNDIFHGRSWDAKYNQTEPYASIVWVGYINL